MIGRRLGQHTPCNYWSKWQVELVENLLQFIHQNALVHNVLERWSVEPEIVVSWWDDPLIFTKTNFENLNCHQMSTSILLFQYGSTWWFDMMVKWRGPTMLTPCAYNCYMSYMCNSCNWLRISWRHGSPKLYVQLAPTPLLVTTRRDSRGRSLLIRILDIVWQTVAKDIRGQSFWRAAVGWHISKDIWFCK